MQVKQNFMRLTKITRKMKSNCAGTVSRLHRVLVNRSEKHVELMLGRLVARALMRESTAMEKKEAALAPIRFARTPRVCFRRCVYIPYQ